MEDRLQKVLEKKKVKNNYKHIEVLPTLNDNTSTDTTVNIENPSPSVTSSTKTVQSDKSESSTNTGKNKKPKESVIENFEIKTESLLETGPVNNCKLVPPKTTLLLPIISELSENTKE